MAVAATAGAAATATAPAFYGQLAKPPWAPAATVFAPVWTGLYMLMAVAAWLVWQKRRERPVALALVLFVLQLAANALWSWLFFAGGLAFGGLLVLMALVLATLAAFWRVRGLAGLLLVPYLAWLGFAGALNWTVWHANPRSCWSSMAARRIWKLVRKAARFAALHLKERIHVPQHPHAVQFRSAGHRTRDTRRFAAIRAQAQWLNVPSRANEAAFEQAVEQVAASARQLIAALVTSAEPRTREVEAERAKAWFLLRWLRAQRGRSASHSLSASRAKSARRTTSASAGAMSSRWDRSSSKLRGSRVKRSSQARISSASTGSATAARLGKASRASRTSCQLGSVRSTHSKAGQSSAWRQRSMRARGSRRASALGW